MGQQLESAPRLAKVVYDALACRGLSARMASARKAGTPRRPPPERLPTGRYLPQEARLEGLVFPIVEGRLVRLTLGE